MPSNPTLPEDVQAEAARIIQAMFASAPTPGEVVSAIAPLIIEWARKDVIAWLEDADYADGWNFTLANNLRAQFTTTDETGASDE